MKVSSAILLIIVFFTISTFSSIAQDNTFSWVKTIKDTIKSSKNYNIIGSSSIKIDDKENIFIGGNFSGSLDFDPGKRVSKMSTPYNPDNLNYATHGFIEKMDSSGKFLWVKQFGGRLGVSIRSINLDRLGNIYACGNFSDTADFDPGPGVHKLICTGFWDAFILKLDSQGNFLWVKAITGKDAQFATTVVTDSLCNVFTSGHFFKTSDFNPGGKNGKLTSKGGEDVFIMKMDSSGSFEWVKQIGGTGTDAADGFVFDFRKNIYISGVFSDTVDFDPGSGKYLAISKASMDIFILKLDSEGSFIWVKTIGGKDYSIAEDITIDKGNNVYIANVFKNTFDFDPGPGTFNLTSNGKFDICIEKLDSQGNFIWAKQMSGSDDDIGFRLLTDKDNNIIISGQFGDTVDFDPGINSSNLISKGGIDMFVQKLDSQGNFIWAKGIGSKVNDYDYPKIAYYANNDLYLTGDYYDTTDCDPGLGVKNIIATNQYEMFILKLGYVSTLTSAPNEKSKINESYIYPNPNSGSFAIVSPDQFCKVEIKDITGRTIYSMNEQASKSEIILNAPVGLYFVSIYTRDVNKVLKLLKQ